uniref:L0008-like protein n=15 Tax=Escherichia coli TaxID=562 RepID=Q8VR62_ECOLX|nr:L0008-like protein [Escherichia coli]
MKLALTLEADSINVQALNMGRIVVDVDGVNLAELINHVAENGYSLRVVEESDQQSTCTPPPFTALAGIRCSTAHITEKDNAWLYSLSHQTNDFGESEWIHFTGSGYLLRTDAWSYPVLRLKRLGLSKTFRRLVVTLIRRMASVSFIWMPALNVCLTCPLSTGNQEQHEIINHGNSTGYSDCVAAGQYRLRIGNYL